MALNKSLSTEFGVRVEYWKITAIHLGCNFNKCQIGVSGYINEDLRLEDNKPLWTENYTIKDEDFEKYLNIEELSKEGNNIISACYKYLKENIDKFKDSQNV